MATEEWSKFMALRFYLMFKCFKELFGMMFLVVALSKFWQRMLFKLQIKEPTYNNRVQTSLIRNQDSYHTQAFD